MASMDLTDSMDLSLSKLQEIVKDRKTRQAAIHGVEKYWSFSISPSTEYSGLISFKIDWFDLLAVRGTLKSFFYSWKASVLPCSAFMAGGQVEANSHPRCRQRGLFLSQVTDVGGN